jgi:hypothetical protein
MDALFFRLRQMLLAMLMKKLAVTGTIYLPLKKLGFFGQMRTPQISPLGLSAAIALVNWQMFRAT